MHERIYTIPVNTAFEQHDECPFCLLYKQLEDTEIDLITGASMMEPDVRVRTNELGFCRHHFDRMYANQKRLSLALTIQSHLEQLKKEITAGGFLARDTGAKPVKRINELNGSCYVCGRIKNNFTKMFETACLLFEEERDFRDKFMSQKMFCLPHYAKLLEVGKQVLSKRFYPELVKEADAIEQAYLESLYEDISLFCKKFDYRYQDTPWGTAKDSVERSIDFLKSKK